MALLIFLRIWAKLRLTWAPSIKQNGGCAFHNKIKTLLILLQQQHRCKVNTQGLVLLYIYQICFSFYFCISLEIAKRKNFSWKIGRCKQRQPALWLKSMSIFAAFLQTERDVSRLLKKDNKFEEESGKWDDENTKKDRNEGKWWKGRGKKTKTTLTKRPWQTFPLGGLSEVTDIHYYKY